MMQFDRIALGRKAKDLGFVRDTFEKVCRLIDVFKFMQEDPLLSESLALKGGTAINLTVFDLPRLSVDIDLDYSKDVQRDEMMEDRVKIRDHIQKYMIASGYTLNPKSKDYHALESMVYDYMNAGGMKDNLKIEINYMLRCHVLPLSRRCVKAVWGEDSPTVLSVAPLEIFSAKAVALLNRTAPRDLYDMYNLQKYGILDEADENVFRKCVIYYGAIASVKVPEKFEIENIERVSAQKVKTDLTPVLHRAEHFNLNEAKGQVKGYLEKVLAPLNEEQPFWKEFARGEYHPEVLFDDDEIISRIRQHPMALWKCSKNKEE